MDEFPVRLKRYKTPWALLSAYAGHRFTARNSVNRFIVWPRDQVSGASTVTSIIKDIETAGYWAYCKHGTGNKSGQINYWISSTAGYPRLVSILAHELAHLAGYHEESDAAAVEAIAGFACKLAGRYGERHKH